MNVKTLLALSAFALLLLGCAGSQQAPSSQPPAVQPSAPSAIGGVELSFNESQSIDDLTAASGTASTTPSTIGGIDLSFNETASINDLSAASST
ncbi:MAG: hypothetical protein WC759_02115 [Candidatus Micrarchaeia archaeon]|jgi:hypothetical protein